jgi:pullulanase
MKIRLSRRAAASFSVALSFLLLFSTVGALGVRAEELVIHYHRPEADYDGWTLWAWDAGNSGAGQEIRSSESDGFGLVFRLDLGQYGGLSRLGLLPKFRNWDGKDDPDRTWTPDMGRNIYVLSADKVVYTAPPDMSPRVVIAYLDAPDRLRLILSKSIASDAIARADVEVVDGGGRRIPAASVMATHITNGRTKILEVTLESPLGDGTSYDGAVAYGRYRPGPLRPGRIVDSFYDGRPLGAILMQDRTVFRVFSPTASAVTVLLYDQPSGGSAREVAMQRAENGIWQASVPEGLAGKYYTYRSTVPEGTFEIIDPYSRSNTAHNGRGMIIADNTPVAPGPTFPMRDAIIYEMHLRDFTIDPSGRVTARGKYLGLYETGTRLAGSEGTTTGLDHLKELGVNVIQIMPIQDFDNNEASENYNWGYMPYHFFSPDGWFATRRDDATRVSEVKRMIDALHREGFKVVLDVVNNHTAEGNPEARISFNGLAPNYYYRVKDDGSYWNGSGCGNEFRSESPMGRKFIVDSLLYWVSEMGVDGFRFDLMGLIDLETMKEVVRQVRAVKPDALIYGEPWAGGQTPIHVTSKGDQRGVGFGVFNDHFRDALKGSTFGKDPGYIQVGRDVSRVKRGIIGSITDFALNADESLNYIEAHDNHTLWDRIELTMHNRPDITRDELVAMDKLGAAIILTSQGVPFIHSGQEMLRTKGGEDNTYNKPDEVNMIHWSWKAENRDVFDYYRGLIALRRAHPMFRLSEADAIRKSLFFLDDDLGLTVPQGGIGYVLNRSTTNDAWENALVLFNPNSAPVEFAIPSSSWIPVVNARAAGEAPLGPPVLTDRVRVAARGALVLHNTDLEFHRRVLAPRLAAKAARRHVFTIEAPTASKVTIAGSFNGWNMDANVMERQADGTWAVTLELDPGMYEYKFVADGNWDALNSANRTVRIP